jgi:serine/threonine-protein kinase
MDLLRPVFEAVAEAHERGIVHRDIKPGNIMRVASPIGARRRNARPPIRLLDFGIAKVMAPDEQRPPKGDTDTRSGASPFSLRYASPEQLGRMRTGPWTDVHALALVLAQMLTDREPFPGDNEMAVMSRVLDDQRPTPARFGVDVGALEPVLARALAKNHAERYPDAGALLDAIDAAIGLPRRSVPSPASAHDRNESSSTRPSDPEVVLGDAHTVAPFRTELPVTSSGARPLPSSPPRGARIGVVVAAATASLLLVVALWSRSMKPPAAPGRLLDANADATTSTVVPAITAPEASIAAPLTAVVTTTDAASPSAHPDGPSTSSRIERPRPHVRTPRDASVTVAPPRPTTEAPPVATVDAGRTPRFDPGRLKVTFASPPKENR